MLNNRFTEFSVKFISANIVYTGFKKSMCWIVVLSILSSICYADKFTIYVSGGPAFAKLRNNTSVSINDFVVNNYITNIDTHWDGLWGIGVAHSFDQILDSQANLSIGVAGYSYNFGNIQGTEYPFANDGVYDTLNYKFQAQSKALMFESRLFLNTSENWEPFILVGIGSSWNNLNNYNENPTDPSLSAAPVPQVFGNNTNQALAYELGIGVNLQIYNTRKICYSASVDYRYFNFGKGQLGGFPALTTNDRLTVNKLYTRGMMLSLNASFV